MASSHIQIRFAVESDMSQVHDLVQELAIYEGAADQVITSPTIYRRDFSAGCFQVLVAVEADKIVGIALFYEAYSTWKGKMLYLDDLVVTLSHRRKGIGTKLLQALLKVARDREIGLVKWQVLDWNDSAVQFYEKHHAHIEKGWWNVKIELSKSTG